MMTGKLNRLLGLLAAALFVRGISTCAQPAKIFVAVDHPGHRISPTLWGIFFEDINMSSDGGICPELVRNRSFEDSDEPDNWKFTSIGNGKSEAAVITADVHATPPPLNAFNRKSLRVKVDGAFAVQNEGYWGMNIVSAECYALKLAARGENFEGKLEARILSSRGEVLASGEISEIGGRWGHHSMDLTAAGTDPKAKLEISGAGKGVLFLDMVSLLPKKTFKDHGLRSDLGESLDGLHPSFMRFPGGCWVEGDDFAHMNHWKNTIGNINTRAPLWNIWGYNATQGLGYHEYLQLAEDLDAEPLFCVNVGMSHKEYIPMDRMAQWVQDALDAIEYANGPTNSVWGAMRAEAGHPAPFKLKYMEIGNENGGQIYRQRWPLFVNAIHARYPEIQFVADHWQGSYPPSPRPDIVDEHFYNTPEWFMRNAHHFDNYDRNGPKIFVGEYAVTRNCGLGNLRGAIGEAAFMTGLERNSDHVIMASYAPLLVNLNHRAWNPDLINFDSSKWYGLPSYYVQKMFAENRGDFSFPIEVQSPNATTTVTDGKFGVGTWNTAAEFKDVKVTAPDGTLLFQSDFRKGTDAWTLLGSGAAWSVREGALRQTAEREFIRALAGKREWTDYTLTLKARKVSGAEGFLILFAINGDEERTWWNIGGWGNTQDAIEADGTLDAKPSEIETGRWYDIRLELRGQRVKCYLDGALIHDVNYQSAESTVPAIYACAARDDQSGDVIVKVVNAAHDSVTAAFSLGGSQFSPRSATAIVLTSESPTDENSLKEPMKVSPKREEFAVQGAAFSRMLPGNSFTVLRVHGHNGAP